MVHLAPHLVYPTPYLVPTLGDDRRDVKIGIGLNMYDVMATTRVGQGRRQRAPSARRSEGENGGPTAARVLVAGPPPDDPGGGGDRADPGARAARPEVRLPLLRLPDRRRPARADDPRRGRALRRGDGEPARGHLAARARRPGRGVVCRYSESGDDVEIRAANVDQRDRRLGGPDPARRDPRRDRGAADRSRAAGPTSPCRSSCCRSTDAACIVPAGAGRTIFVLPWYGRVLVGTTDNDYDGDIDHVRPGGDDVEYLLDAVNYYFGTAIERDDLTGAYAGVRPLISTGDPKKSVDISRKAELYETSSGMLTITGGKLTTWRRMAKLVVDRIAMREERELPCRTTDIPLGMEARPRTWSRPRGPTGRPARGPRRAAGLPLRARRAGPCSRSPPSGPSWRRRSSPGSPTCSPRRRSPHGWSRRGASATSSCAGRASPLLAAPQLTDAESVMPVARAIGAELGWDEDADRRGGGRGRRSWPRRGPNAGRRVRRWQCPYPARPHGFRPRKRPPRRPPRPRRRARRRALPHARPRGARRGDRSSAIPTPRLRDRPEPSRAEAPRAAIAAAGAATGGRKRRASATTARREEDEPRPASRSPACSTSRSAATASSGSPGSRSEDDVYVSPSQIRRCELRSRRRGRRPRSPAAQGRALPGAGPRRLDQRRRAGRRPTARLLEATPVHPPAGST